MKLSEKRTRIVITLATLAVAAYSFLWRQKVGISLALVQTFLLLVVAYSSAPVIADLLGIKAGRLFTGKQKTTEIPLLSEAESAVRREDFEKAVKLYRDIQDKFPDYLPLYKPLLEVLLIRLNNKEEAREVYRIGWMKMNKSQRKKLERLFKEYSQNVKEETS